MVRAGPWHESGHCPVHQGAIATGERTVFRRFPDEVQFHVMGGATWNTQDRARDIASAERAWDKARELLRDPAIGLVVLDRLNIALKYQYLEPGKSPR